MAALVRRQQTLPWAGLARAAWLLIAGLSLGLLAVLVPINVHTVYLDWQFHQSYPAVASFVTRGTYAAYYIGLNYAVALLSIAVAVLIHWRRAAEPVAWLASVLLMVAPVSFGLGGYTEYWSYYPAPWRPVFEFIRSFLAAAVTLPSLLGFIFLFPHSRPRTRWPAGLLALALATVIPAGIWVALGDADNVWFFWMLSFTSALLVAAGVQVYRYMRLSSPLERQQSKWVVAGMAALIASLLGLSGLIGISENTPYAALVVLGAHHVQILLLAFFPLALAFSILRYRLWNIDVLLNRALVYGTLTACVVALYVVLVGVAGVALQNFKNPLLAIVALGLLAFIFQPLRQRLQTAVNRLMYGERDDPATALSRLGQRLEAALTPGLEMTTIVETVAQALRLPYVAIEIREGEIFSLAAAAGRPAPQVELIPLVYQAQTIGRLVAAPRAPGEAFSSADRRLLSGLASQAAPAVHAHRLAADLQRSRERIVIAREEERRRLRRDLHDGFGPALASQALKLDAALDLLARDRDTAARLLSEVKAQSQDTVADIRRLVYALRPPALDELGLVGALNAHLQTLPQNGLRISLKAGPLPPLSAAVEVAAYRVTLEAVTNTVRHAQASECRVQLAVVEGALEIEVVDNGRGLPDTPPEGVGLASLRERAAELGGSGSIDNLPAGGVRVHARLPLGNNALG